VSKPVYPLKQVLEVKIRREDDARKLVDERKRALEREQQKLNQLVEARDKVRKHYDDKLAQLRQELDQTTTTEKIQQAKAYLKIVQANLEKEDKKVADQKAVVTTAMKALDDAKAALKQRQQEVEKIKLHRTEWQKEAQREHEKKIEAEQDEIGQILHQSRQLQEKQQKPAQPRE
jgi:chromosome segregation ATPase